MVDEGLVDLDTPVTAYLGDDWYGKYEHGPQITLRHLMGHTTGFVEYAFDPGFFVLGSARLGVPIAPEEIVRFTTNYGPVAEFETEYKYSTAGHVHRGDDHRGGHWQSRRRRDQVPRAGAARAWRTPICPPMSFRPFR